MLKNLAAEPVSIEKAFDSEEFRKNRGKDINRLQFEIRKKILEEGEFYIVQTIFRDKAYLRYTIINPLTTIEDIKTLLEKVRETAKKLE